MKRSVEKFLLAGLVLVIIASIAIVIILIRQSQKTNDTAQWISHTDEVLYHSERVLAVATDNETDARGYTLTGDDKFLELLQKSEAVIYTELAQLKKLTADNAVQQIRIDSLTKYINKRIEFSDRLVTERQTKGIEAASKLAATGEGKLYMDNARQLVYQLQADENVLLEQQKAKYHQAVTQLNNLWGGLMLSMFFLIVIILLIVRKVFASRKKSAYQLLQLNQQLEEKVRINVAERLNIFERITNAFISLDTNWCYTYMNNKAGEFFNRDPTEITGKNIWTEFPEAVDQAFYKACHRAMAEQQHIHVEEYFVHSNQWIENHIYPSPEGLSIFSGDITEKKKWELAIKESEEKYRLLIDQAADAIFITDLQGNIIEANIAASNLSGYSQDEIQALTISDFVENTNLNTLQALFPDMKAGKTIITERSLKRKDGSIAEVEVSIKAVSGGKLQAIVRDITERKKAEDEIKEKGKFIESLVTASPNIIYIRDIEEQKIVYYNQGIQKKMDYSETEIQQMGNGLLALLMHPDDFDRYMQNTFPRYATAQDGEIISHQFRMKDKTGNWHWYYCKESIYLRKPDGKPQHIFGVIIDVTKFKEQEKKLAEREQQLKLFIENSPAALAMLDKDMKYIITSNRWLKDYDLGAIDLSGKSYYEIFPDLSQERKEIHKRCLAGATEKKDEEMFVSADGSINWARWEILPWYNQGDEIGGIIILSELITERKNIEEKIKKSEELLEATGELAKVGGWEIDTSNMTVRWTKEVYHIHEIEPGKMPEVSEAINYYAPEARPVIQKAVNDAITKGEGWDLELPFITAKGNRLWVRAIGRVENKDNTKRIFGIFQDITVRKIEEEKLKLHNEKLSEIAFLQSHQVRTPIANILGLISLINFNNLADPANAEVLENLLETTKMFDKIIADVVRKTNEIKKMGNNRDNFTVNKNELIKPNVKNNEKDFPCR